MARVLVLCAGILALAACDVGRVGPPGDDSGDDTGGVDAAAALLCRNAGTPGAGHNVATHPEGNKGQSCITAACHGAPVGVGAPLYSVAGTLYTAGDGVTVAPGGVVTVVDATGIVVDMVADAYGGFYTGQILTPPFRTFASSCPTKIDMLTSAAGNCNAAGCHVPGTTSGTVFLTP